MRRTAVLWMTPHKLAKDTAGCNTPSGSQLIVKLAPRALSKNNACRFKERRKWSGRKVISQAERKGSAMPGQWQNPAMRKTGADTKAPVNELLPHRSGDLHSSCRSHPDFKHAAT